jgi:hypothetical protein
MAETFAKSETARIEAFSDGVFAIAITLLILAVEVPKAAELGEEGLGTALLAQWPQYLAFVTSFATILAKWINHHRIFNYIQPAYCRTGRDQDRSARHLYVFDFHSAVVEGISLMSLSDHDGASEKFSRANLLYAGRYLPGMPGKIIEHTRLELDSLYRTAVKDGVWQTRSVLCLIDI